VDVDLVGLDRAPKTGFSSPQCPLSSACQGEGEGVGERFPLSDASEDSFTEPELRFDGHDASPAVR
jgi:hypothetical protein